MKNLNKISIFLFLLLGITFTSCETTDLDLLDDPNNVTLDKADLERYMVAIQIDFKSFVSSFGSSGSELTRINYMFGRTYIDNYSAETTNGEWGLAYQGMFSDMVGAELLATEQGKNKHLGVMRIIKAYTLMTLVDFYGDVPNSEASNPSEFPFPHADDDAVVYAAAMDLLNEGIAFLDEPGDAIANDFYYNNDYGKWKKLANTLKMRTYLNTRLVDSDAINKFNAIVNSGDYITNTSDDFEFRYGSSPSNPNTRHPSYNSDYNVSGASSYRSNWLMEKMLDNNDPRIRYYFFRQIACTPGSVDANGVSCPTNQAQLQCSTQPKPAHYPTTMAYCNVASGYWGRDHGNNEGIPPDSFKRTASGVYPAGGRFDDDDYTFVGLDQGGQGAGIMPVMLASWVDLMRAEVALIGGNTSDANALILSSLSKSIAKVKTFRSLDPDADASFEPTPGEITAYIAAVGASFTSANSEDKWNILADQQFIAHYGNGIDSYNFYRRTGFPKTLQYNVEVSSGNFVRSFLYPADEANTNSNISQKLNVNGQIFWDNNPASPSFPFAN